VDKIKELKEILKTVGAQNIWRPVVIREDQLLANGIADPCDGLRDSDGIMDFEGKTIVDLGCNFGYYSFFARSAGASYILGIDIDERVIRGCKILKTLHEVDRVNFRALDITKANEAAKFEIGMMIDVIGKDMIRTGTAKDLLNSLERLSQKEMLLTLRPRYHIKKNLQADFQGLKEKYPGNYIKNSYFYMLDYVRDRFKAAWEIHIISDQNDPEVESKQTLHFVKRKQAIKYH